MKKGLLIMAVVLLLGLMTSFAHAQVPALSERALTRPSINDEQWETWHKEKMEWKRSYLEEALREGLITEEQAKIWREHFDHMEKFHNENGFLPGLCHYGFKNGNGHGMMRGHRWQR